MRLYAGIDLHANNNYLAIIGKKGKRIDQKKEISVRVRMAISPWNIL